MILKMLSQQYFDLSRQLLATLFKTRKFFAISHIVPTKKKSILPSPKLMC